MQHFKTIPIPSSFKRVLDRTTCDICQSEIGLDHVGIGTDTIVKHSTVNDYGPDCGGDGKDTTLDICSKCFTEKLVPWAVAQGVKPRIESYDW